MDLARARLRLAGVLPPLPSAASLRSVVAGRLAVVTGASSGVGAAVACALAASGARLVLVARGDSSDRAAALDLAVGRCRALGADARALALDLRDADDVDAASRALLAEHGAPSIVVANAGHSIERRMLDAADRAHDARRLALVHHLGHAALVLPWLPSMPRGGVVVGVTTAVATMPTPGFGAYVASKAALDVWLRTLDAELAPRVRASSVRLPLVDTRMVAPHRSRALALSAAQAAGIVCGAIVRPRPIVGPWWSRAAGAMGELAPATTARIVRGATRGSA